VSVDKNFYAIYAENGTQAWNYTTGGPIVSSPTVSDGVVYFGSNDGYLYALNILGEAIPPSPPIITIFNPTNNTYPSTSIALNVQADITTNLWYYDIGAGNQTFTPNTTITVSEGSNTIVVWANSTDGVWGSASVAFTVTIPAPPLIPKVTIFSPTNTTYSTSSVSLSVSSNISVNKWYYDLGAGNITFTPNTTITAAEGSNTLTVWANSTSGGWGRGNIVFSVNTSLAPTPPITGSIIAGNPILSTVIPMVVAFGVITFIFASELLSKRKLSMKEVVTGAVGMVIVIMVIVFLLAYYLTL
jgi:outer membrane protein assembly factor BamB